MKRPLFAVCLCLVIAMAIWRGYQSYDHNREGSDSMYQMMKAQDNSFLTVTGRVYQKDNQNFYLDSVYYQIEAVGLQQTFSLSENLICEYPKGVELKLGCIVKLRGRFDVFEKACFYNVSAKLRFDFVYTSTEFCRFFNFFSVWIE